jgi:hypothetical protein
MDKNAKGTRKLDTQCRLCKKPVLLQVAFGNLCSNRTTKVVYLYNTKIISDKIRLRYHATTLKKIGIRAHGSAVHRFVQWACGIGKRNC